MSESTLAIGVITSGNISLATTRSLLDVYGSQVARAVHLHQSGPYLDDARNELVRWFHRTAGPLGCDRLLMVCSDIEFTLDDVLTLVDANLPIVSGVYYSHLGPHGEPSPVVYQWEDSPDSPSGRHLAPISSWGDEWPIDPSEPMPDDLNPFTVVAGVGAGFFMVRCDVLDRLEVLHGDPCPWFYEEIRDSGHLGEDLAFCLRAEDAGFHTLVDRRVQVAHHKGIRLGGQVMQTFTSFAPAAP